MNIFLLTFSIFSIIMDLMNLLWVADFSLRHSPGGAQRSDDILIRYGRENGINITEFNYDTNPSLALENYDVVVSANLERLSYTHNGLIDIISSHVRHFRLEHDSNSYLDQNQRKNLFGSCIKSFFLTEFHLDQFVKSYGDIFNNPVIVPDPIDTQLFTNNDLEREDVTIYTGFMHELKGTNVFIEHARNNPDKNFRCASWGDEQFETALRDLGNVDFLGKLNFDEMPSFYNKHKSMFYKPVFYEPFCRSVAEAIFSGVKIESNDKIGCLHEMKRIGEKTLRDRCSKAPELFWNIIKSYA